MIELTVINGNIQDNEDIIKFQLTNGDHNYIIFTAINDLSPYKKRSTYILDDEICKNLRELLKNI